MGNIYDRPSGLASLSVSLMSIKSFTLGSTVAQTRFHYSLIVYVLLKCASIVPSMCTGHVHMCAYACDVSVYAQYVCVAVKGLALRLWLTGL